LAKKQKEKAATEKRRQALLASCVQVGGLQRVLGSGTPGGKEIVMAIAKRKVLSQRRWLQETLILFMKLQKLQLHRPRRI
jgi:hypothetical protein